MQSNFFERPALLANVGRCILACQTIEMMLADMIVMGRGQKGGDADTLLRQFAALRLDHLGALEKKLSSEKNPYVDFKYLQDVIERRNLMAHRLCHDPKMVASIRTGDDLFDEVKFFKDAFIRIKAWHDAASANCGRALHSPSSDEILIERLPKLESWATQVSKAISDEKEAKKKRQKSA